MKPEFALSLTHEGIRLLQRSEDGWLVLGAIELAQDDVDAELAKLREKAEAHAQQRPIRTKLILPNTEVLYEQVDVSGATGPDYETLVREALEGRTPYTVDELSYDYVVSGKTAQIAVVAREILIEAEDFAVAHAFNPVSFAAIPPKDSFAGEPMFGTTRAAETLLADGEALERDSVPVVIVGHVPEAPGASDVSAHPPASAKNPVANDEGDQAPQPTQTRRIPPAPPRDTPPEAPQIRAERPEANAARGVGTAKALKRPAVLAAIGFLAILLVAGTIALLRDQSSGDATTETVAPQPPEVQTSVALPEPETAPGSPSPTATIAAPSVETADTDPPDAAPTGPDLPTSASQAPQVESAAAPQVMPEMDSTLVSPQSGRLTAFEQAPLPEEIAEGEEAVPEQAAQSLVVTPNIRPDALAPAPIAGAGPGLLEAERFYAVTGIWQRSPEQPVQPPLQDLDELYVASLDARIEIDDALALPSYEEDRDGLFETPQPPFAPGLVFDLDDNGRVIATPEGALSPDGVIIFEGAGTTRPEARPFNDLPDTNLERLAQLRPAPRPANATELVERAELAGRTRSELAALSPRARPASAQQEALAEADATPSALAVARAPAPTPRPSRIDAIVAEIRAAQAQQQPSAGTESGASATTASLAAVAPAPAAPAIPTTASVARQATLENAMRLEKLNLIGVYGGLDNRRALVRTPAGRYLKVQVGDRLDGGRVAVIGENSLQYTKGSRNITLEVPNG